MIKLEETDVKIIKGIGDAKAKQLLRLGIRSVWDLLTHFPVRFEDRSRITDIYDTENDKFYCINAVVVTPPSEHFVRKGLTYYKFHIRDKSGIAECIFFNNRFIKNMIRVGCEYSFYGKVSIRGKKKELVSPDFEPVFKSECTKRITAVYPLTSGLTQNFMRKIISEAYERFHSDFHDVIPPAVLRAHSLCSVDFAIKNIHFPKDLQALEIAKRRLVFEEFFILQTTLRKMKSDTKKEDGICFENTDISPFLAALPFSLTSAQKKVTEEILADFAHAHALNRLVQGDVGSGKTIIAAIAIYVCAKNSFQSAMMAPTEVLARQHYNDLSPLLEKFNIKSALLCGSTPQKEKKEIYRMLASGEISVVFGTHALIENKVQFSSLALAITDEQHRFGVRQRMRLGEKGNNVHTLVMTATPIPRTLALIVYGDMDISVIDTLPPGRKPVDTYCVGENMRERIYKFIRAEIAKGNSCYFVCPAVDESENIPLKSVNEHYNILSSKIFPDIPCGMIHGKMKAADKEKVMADFVCGKTKILVSTTVIEVGVNVPHATLMVIENAERFGLSQLHQLRGRVGRGNEKSYCVLFCSSFSDDIKERMRIMVESSDGFKISEKDLSLRGPGDFFGTRQHGALHFKIADLAENLSDLKESGTAADKLLKDDPLLKKDENLYIRESVNTLAKSLTL